MAWEKGGRTLGGPTENAGSFQCELRTFHRAARRTAFPRCRLSYRLTPFAADTPVPARPASDSPRPLSVASERLIPQLPIADGLAPLVRPLPRDERPDCGLPPPVPRREPPRGLRTGGELMQFAGCAPRRRAVAFHQLSCSPSLAESLSTGPVGNEALPLTDARLHRLRNSHSSSFPSCPKVR